MDSVGLKIDGKAVKAEKGATILQAAREAGIYIPTLCSRPDLTAPLGGCRLCVVEAEGAESRFPTACTTPVAVGMVVRTGTPLVQEIRRHNMIALLAPLPAPRLKRAGLKKLAAYIGVKESGLPPYVKRNLPVDRTQPLLELDNNRCIQCGLCVRACQEMRGVGAIGFVMRDGRLAIGSYPAATLDENGCRFCGACAQVCPTGAITYKIGRVPGEDEGVAPCVSACPAGMDVPRYVRLVSERRFAEAAAVIHESVPFAGVLGEVCPHPCEDKCLRGEVNEAISIAGLKRAAAERDTRSWRASVKIGKPTGKKVAIAGSGPAGLTAAYYLAKAGHTVTVFEALPRAGGMMQAGIPEYRLPRAVLLPEIDEIRRVGVDMRTGSRIERVADLLNGYDAVLLAVGTHKALKLNVPGEEKSGVLEAISLLRDVNLGKPVSMGGTVGVIGGGSVAIDAARTALRLGAKRVELICLESRNEMPAYADEIKQAAEEGVNINCGWGVKSIAGNGAVSGVECKRCTSVFDKSGKFSPAFDESKLKRFEVDTLIVAIGQTADLSFLAGAGDIAAGSAGTIKVGRGMTTGRAGVFAAGDAVNGPSTVIEAIASGKKAASSIDRFLGGKGVRDEKLVETEDINGCLGSWKGFAGLSRAAMPCLPVKQRAGFVEVETGLSEKAAVAEAGRCLQCQLRFQIPPVAAPPGK